MKKLNIRLTFAAFMVVLFGYAVIEARNFKHGAYILPIAVGVPGFVFVLIQFIRELRFSSTNTKTGQQEILDIAADHTIPTKIVYAQTFRLVAWWIGLYVVTFILGFKIAATVFLIAFMRTGKVRWVTAIGVTAGTILLYSFFQSMLSLTWPDSLLGDWLKNSPLSWLF